MAGRGKSGRGRGGRSGRSAGGVLVILPVTEAITGGGDGVIAGGGSSSHSSNSSSTTRPAVSRPSSSTFPSQYPASTLSPSRSRSQSAETPPPQSQSQPPRVHIPQIQVPPVQIPQQPPPPAEIPEQQPSIPPEHQDFDRLLDDMLALPGRQCLPLLSQYPIPDVETTWFNRDKSKLTRVICDIFRKKFDGPYFNWSKTPIHIRERYLRSFARKYNWDSVITELVREHFMRIGTRRMKGIASQAKRSGERPVWIPPSVRTEMWKYWETEEAFQKSENASNSRNFECGGAGAHKHLSGQKSFLQVQQDMEEELGLPVSLGEVFMKTHTRADGSFVDQKAKKIVEAYDKSIEEVMAEMDDDGLEASEHSSQQSTHRNLSIQEKDEIFLKCTEKDAKGNLFGLGRLAETIKKGKKRKECCASTSSPSHLEIEHLREQQHNDQSRISNLEMIVSYFAKDNPGLADFMANQTQATAAATNVHNAPATGEPNPPANATATSSSSPLT